MFIDMSDFTVELIRKRIKNINLRINARGQVKISAPIKFPLALIHSYLQDKHDWIKAHRARLQARPVVLPATLQMGEYHFFLGQCYQIIKHEDVCRGHITLDEKHMHFFVGAEMALAEQQFILQNWYRQQMIDLLPGLVKKWESIIGVQANEYRIKTMKTRWGSCNTSARRVWLNLSLIQKPLVCLEYVLVHELVHLLEPSHNKRFYALMSQFMPDWKNCQKQLEMKGSLDVLASI